MSRNREIELKLELTPADAGRLRDLPFLAACRKSKQHQHNVYFDTPDYQLRRAGLSLRLRRSGRCILQTVKTQGKGAGLFDRGEWETRIAGMEPDFEAARETPLASLLTAAGGDLAALATVDVDREAWSIADGNDRLELTLDEAVFRAAETHLKFDELELELRHGSPKALFAFCEKLASRIPLRLSVLSKADRAFALADGKLQRTSTASRVRLTENVSVADAFTKIALSCVEHFRLNESALVEQRNPEALHQAHVAMRRLRCALAFFRPVLRRSRRFRALCEELRRCGRKLGQARDCDVFLALLNDHAIANLRAVRLRHSKYDEVLALLNSRRFLAMMLRLVAWLHVGRWRRRDAAQVPIGCFAIWRLEAAWAKLSHERLPLRRLTEKSRHELRIRTKQFRYALEFMWSVVPDHHQRRKLFVGAVEALQDDLGELNDMAMAKRLAADCSVDAERLINGAKREALDKTGRDYVELLATAPYWRANARPPEAASSRRRGGSAPTAASRRRGPRSAGCAPG